MQDQLGCSSCLNPFDCIHACPWSPQDNGWVLSDCSPVAISPANVLRLIASDYSQRQDTTHNPHVSRCGRMNSEGRGGERTRTPPAGRGGADPP